MRFFNKSLLVLTLSVISTITSAADITDTYNTGDTLTTTTLNNIKSSVNSKQDRITEPCPLGAAIGSINADGTVTCETDDDTVYTDADATSAISSLLPAVKQTLAVNSTLLAGNSGNNTVVNLTTTPPHDGYLYITGSGTVIVDNVSTQSANYYNQVQLSLSPNTSPDSAYQTTVTVDVNGNSTRYFYTPFSVDRILAVTGGVPLTINLIANRDNFSEGNMQIFQARLFALFVPNLLP